MKLKAKQTTQPHITPKHTNEKQHNTKTQCNTKEHESSPTKASIYQHNIKWDHYLLF